MAPLGALVGGGIAGWLVDRFGRKSTLILTGLPNFVGWFLLGVSYFITFRPVFVMMLLVGRFFSGVGMGWAMLSAPVSNEY